MLKKFIILYKYTHYLYNIVIANLATAGFTHGFCFSAHAYHETCPCTRSVLSPKQIF